MKPHKLLLGLGSNLGSTVENIQQALSLLDERVGSVHRVSNFMESEPMGFSSPNKFLNVVCMVHTHLSPHRCLLETQDIERQMGRIHKTQDGAYTDRIIDIDILMYDDLRIDTPDLTIPHPRMEERPFVMLPMAEILAEEEESLY